MRFRKPCAHGVYDDHQACPGGEFLADDALVIEPKGLDTAVGYALRSGWPQDPYMFAEKLLDALTVREGAEPICGDSQHRHLGACELYAKDAPNVRKGAG